MAEFQVRKQDEKFTITADGYEHNPNLDTYVFFNGTGEIRENVVSIPRHGILFVGRKDAVEMD